MRRLATALLCLVAAVAPPGLQAQRSKADDLGTQKLIFFSPKNAVLIELRFVVDGQPARRWFERYVQRWVQAYDRDGDGKLDAKELAYLPRAFDMQRVLTSGYYYPSSNKPVPIRLADLGLPPDGKAGAAELVKYYQKYNAFRIVNRPVYPNAPPVASVDTAVFQRLDLNQDGKLSAKEMSSAAKTLLDFDFNDDELVGLDEIAAGGRGYVVAKGGNQMMRRPNPRGMLPEPFFSVGPSESRAQLTALILSRYDKNRDTKLSRSELPIGEVAFRKLDLNRDKQLSVSEMVLFVYRLRPVTFLVRVGDTGGRPAVEILTSEDVLKLNHVRVLSRSDRSLRVSIAGSRVTVASVAGSGAGQMMKRNVYAYLFRMANPKGKDFLERKDLENNPRAVVLRRLMNIADRNRDDKLTLEELEFVSQLVNAGREGQIGFSVREEGGGLFQFFDEDGDGFVSQREAQQAARYVATLDGNRDGVVARGEIGNQYLIQVFRGTYLVMRSPQTRPLTRPTGSHGPVWFQRMDVNGDGDVSLREFLGPLEVFRRLDADGNGLLDASEAAKAK